MSEWMDAPDGAGTFWYGRHGEAACLCTIDEVPEARCYWCNGTGTVPEVRHAPRTLAWTTCMGSDDPGTNLTEMVIPAHTCKDCHGAGIIPAHFTGQDEYGDAFTIDPSDKFRFKRADVPTVG